MDENDLINAWKWYNQCMKMIEPMDENDLINAWKWFNQGMKMI